ncbi:NAD-dependent epimerase/dehydratase [Chloroherpeton thalassium ATCC 35110]|uniref:NAD-dependent epimerase/dehydratase n=1 Tax=Chloroherpeton thalassium (strain ATCC 35110 / GB-78) TaxID=517418 RepID=B3QVZ6_CHLT3|nr:SDR family oxidoreductase [Chloroherpeton thalassium]ACF14650.1 NAD-dependent epimerase/dehydratase [Chloroherpeton thalassium ATCC 35110]
MNTEKKNTSASKTAFQGKVLVAGATGKTGQWVIQRLQAYGIPVRALVRSEAKGNALGVDYVVGRVQSAKDLTNAVDGCDAVISALGASSIFGDASPSEVDRDGVIRLVDAAANTGIKKFILVSSLCVTRTLHPMNLFGGVLSMKYAGEEHLRKVFSQEGRSYTIIRPGGLKDGEPFEHKLMFDKGDRLDSGFINRSDVAEVAVLSLWMHSARNETFEMVSIGEEAQDSLEPYFEHLETLVE